MVVVSARRTDAAGLDAGPSHRIEVSGRATDGRMPSLTRRALLGVTVAGAAGAAGCAARSRTASPTPGAPDELDRAPLYVADGVALPDGADPITVEDPVGGRVALFPSDPPDPAAPRAALGGATPVVVVGRDARETLADVCAADGRSYGFADDDPGPTARAAAAVPLGDTLVTHLFEEVTLPRGLPGVLDRILNPPRYGCDVDPDLSRLPEGFDGRARTLGSAFVHGRTDVAGFVRRDTVRVAPDGEGNRAVVVDIGGTIHAGRAVGGDAPYRADEVRLAASFDGDLRAAGPPVGETDGLRVRRDSDRAENAVEHRFGATDDRTRRRFTACQRSLVTAPRTDGPFSYTASARFGWRAPRLLREDRRRRRDTSGRAVWYDGGR